MTCFLVVTEDIFNGAIPARLTTHCIKANSDERDAVIDACVTARHRERGFSLISHDNVFVESIYEMDEHDVFTHAVMGWVEGGEIEMLPVTATDDKDAANVFIEKLTDLVKVNYELDEGGYSPPPVYSESVTHIRDNLITLEQLQKNNRLPDEDVTPSM